MNSKQFKQTASEHITQVVTNHGFTSKASRWRRAKGDSIHVISLQVRSNFSSIAVNMGAHYKFLPIQVTTNSIDYDLKKIVVEDCEFHTRLTRDGECDSWWEVAGGMDAIKDLINCFTLKYEIYFSRFELRLELIEKLTFDEIDSPLAIEMFPATSVRRMLCISRTLAHFGRKDLSKEWAAFGLENLGRATGLKNAFKELVNAGE